MQYTVVGKNGEYRAIDPRVARDEEIRRAAIRGERLEVAAKVAIAILKGSFPGDQRPAVKSAIGRLERALGGQ